MSDIIVTRPVTPEYERGHVEAFGEKPERFCRRCGQLPYFCECNACERGGSQVARMEHAASMGPR